MQNARVHRIEYIFVPFSFGANPAVMPGEFNLQQKLSYPRRFFSRVETRVDVWVCWNFKGREETSRVRDLSLGGLFVDTAKSTTMGSTVKFDFIVQDGRIGARPCCRK